MPTKLKPRLSSPRVKALVVQRKNPNRTKLRVPSLNWVRTETQIFRTVFLSHPVLHLPLFHHGKISTHQPMAICSTPLMCIDLRLQHRCIFLHTRPRIRLRTLLIPISPIILGFLNQQCRSFLRINNLKASHMRHLLLVVNPLRNMCVTAAMAANALDAHPIRSTIRRSSMFRRWASW